MERDGDLGPPNRAFTCVACVGAKAAQAITHCDLTLPRLLPGTTVLLFSSICVYDIPRPSARRNSTELWDVTERAFTHDLYDPVTVVIASEVVMGVGVVDVVVVVAVVVVVHIFAV